MSHNIIIFVLSIILCCLFAVSAFFSIILWLLTMLREGLQRVCPFCSSKMPATSKYCKHCGHEMPNLSSNPRSNRTFFMIFVVSIILMGISIAGIIYGAISIAHNGAYISVRNALDLQQNSTSTGWNISFEKVGSGHMSKDIWIKNRKPSVINIQSHIKSGIARIDITQGGISTNFNIDGSQNLIANLSKYEDGKVTIKISMENAQDGAISFWWS